MTSTVDPVLGAWYKHLDKGYEFQVVAYDETDGVVEIQHYDGDVEALELNDWYQMKLEQIEPPEDWSGPVDDFESDDVDYSETDMSDDDWNEGLDEWQERRSRNDHD
ncbi:MAG: hypothetical protein P8164_13030 [Gammaproteobacteria bacterium]|jgi:hypothetical protein